MLSKDVVGVAAVPRNEDRVATCPQGSARTGAARASVGARACPLFREHRGHQAAENVSFRYAFTLASGSRRACEMTSGTRV